MDSSGFLEKTHSRESDEECKKSEEKQGADLRVLEKEAEHFNLELNAFHEEGSDIGLRNDDRVGAEFSRKQTEIELSSCVSAEKISMDILGVESIRTEIDADFDSRSWKKKRKYSPEEKGKAKAVDTHSSTDIDDGKLIIDLEPEPERDTVDEEVDLETAVSILLSLASGPSLVSESVDHFEEKTQKEISYPDKRTQILDFRRDAMDQEHYRQARSFAQRHHEKREKREKREAMKLIEQEKKAQIQVDDETEDLQGPYSMAMEMIKKRNFYAGVRNKAFSGFLSPEFDWVPSYNKSFNLLKRKAPSLQDLSLRDLAKNSEALVSLEGVPDELRHRISHLVCNSRKMTANFFQLLVQGSPTEIRARDISHLTEEDFTKIFASCDTKDLTVLQLDLCGRCLPDRVLRNSLARTLSGLAMLTTISLKGAYSLSDTGLNTLAVYVPVLQSINLSECSLITSTGINMLVSCLEFTLREVYIDDCQNIDAMLILPALKKLKYLEVLSMSGIQTVSDNFVCEMIKVHGAHMKELFFAKCTELTNISLKKIGSTCPGLCALDISYLHNLTDLAMKYVANGCRSIHRLKLCYNSFSDEAIAAFLEASGESLSELSLNNITRVGPNTALSLARKCSSSLWSLDLSWCRQVTDETLGVVVDSCLSLRLLKLFGCTQITEVFVTGHSNPHVKIVGLNTMPVLAHLDVLD